jgi:hypothetical protein
MPEREHSRPRLSLIDHLDSLKVLGGGPSGSSFIVEAELSGGIALTCAADEMRQRHPAAQLATALRG